MTNSSADIAGYVGAAAWIPQLLRWGYLWYAKPTITVLLDRTAEIGFTTYGPIFNIRLDMAVDRKDAIIDHISVTIRHRNQETHVLNWMGMKETFSEISDQSGARQTIERDQNAIALKLSTAMLTEKIIRFQDPEFHSGYTPELNKATEHQVFLMKNNPNYHEIFMASEEVHHLIEAYKRYFWWKSGTYTLNFSFRSPSKIIVRENKFTFDLTQHDIDAIRSNIDLIKMAIENQIKRGLSGFIEKTVPWVWKNPSIVPVK
jgi:hypothetical protein